MSPIRRRRFIAGLLTAPLGFSTFSASFAVEGGPRRTFAQNDSDLSAGCVLAWERRENCDGSIDLWAARVSDGDLSALPRCVQRIILWDDVFLHKSVHQTVGQIREAIPNYYGFDCRAEPNGSSFHLAGMNSLGEAIAAVFEAGARKDSFGRLGFLRCDRSRLAADNSSLAISLRHDRWIRAWP
jgi:hypothetical protein